MIPTLSRRRLLQTAAAAVAVLPLVTPDSAYAGTSIQRDTLEAFADTVVPGAKRFAGDRIVAGATAGPGAVDAGAWLLYNDPDVGLAVAIPGLVAAINAEAAAYALTHRTLLDVRVPPFVALDFDARTAVVGQLLRGSGVVQLLWYAVAAMAMLAFHTAGHLDTAAAVRAGHPGLAWLGFPLPDPDGIWRFPDFSYRQELAALHPLTTNTGNPA
ncbi:DUF5987 family protein [Nocardioides marmorisolisilvae]|uniref:Twin-arginine translocation signal domain-containing protein n=1 Tax=Nocardioides marmorisolisilvae TaxID=1542737 RepID=A0A3N0DWQ9_9ACTN|nr:DUF5987 family protein [Nocardioides marmorisolisilvae]RNL80052.1 twin-arginine translocation signal domain-containing protein [Nocardioides marmorisolisilvae]